MKKRLLMILTVICAFVGNITQSSAPLSGTVPQLMSQKKIVWKQLDNVINQLPGNPDNFTAALELIHNASQDRQWITAEIAAMATKLFDQLCSDETLSFEMLTAKLQALRDAAPRLSDSIGKIEKNCKIAIAQRKAAFLPIADITDQWKTYLDTAKTQKDKLEETKKEARSSIEPLQKAVVAANIQDAMAAFNKIDKWLKSLDKLHTTIIDIEGRMQHDADWLNAIALKLPAIETLEKETVGIESYSENANATAVEFMKGLDKVKDKALKNAQAITDKITEAEHKNTKDVGTFERKYQAETSEDMRQELTKREAERRAKADDAIEQMTEEAYQWREIGGIPRVP